MSAADFRARRVLRFEQDVYKAISRLLADDDNGFRFDPHDPEKPEHVEKIASFVRFTMDWTRDLRVESTLAAEAQRLQEARNDPRFVAMLASVATKPRGRRAAR